MPRLISLALGAALAALLLACSASDSTDPGNGGNGGGGGNPPPPPPPPAPVLLKDMVVQSLPSPYYHFTWDSAGRVDSASFASGFTMYQAVYAGGRLSELRNNTAGNQDRLVYHYNGLGQVDTVRYLRPDSTVYIVVALGYADGKLVSLERRRLVAPDSFVVNKTMALAYYADVNLRELKDDRPTVAGFQTESHTVDTYSGYDTGVNVDAFGLLHNDFFDHLVLLPGVVIQKNNPGHITHTGDGDQFTQDNTVTYDAEHRPVQISGDVVLLNGPNQGQHFAVGTSFTYY